MTLILCLLAFGNTSALEEQYKAHVRFLADDLLEGRETTYRGQKLAARYLAAQLAAQGVVPAFPDQTDPFFQEFKVVISSPDPDSLRLRVSGSGQTEELVYGSDYSYMSRGSGELDLEAPIVFVGYGIKRNDYNDYEGVDVKGKWVMILPGQPVVKEKISPFSTQVPESSPFAKMRAARTQGAAGIFYTMNQDKVNGRGLQRNMSLPDLPSERDHGVFPAIQLTEKAWRLLMGKKMASRCKKAMERINKSGKPRSFQLKKRSATFSLKVHSEMASSENVVGILPGTDPVLKDEFVVISAHYDHEGIKGGVVYNGADDNASGSATLLLAAQYMRPEVRRRSLIILLVSGEEKGLLGSRYFVHNPIVPLEKIVANINIDMIGRSDDGSVGMIPALINGVTSLNEMAGNVNEMGSHNLTLRTDMDRYHTRSDHYNFSKKNVPAIFFFTGTHEDYHQPGDDWEKLHYDEMAHFFTFFKDFTLKAALKHESNQPLERAVKRVKVSTFFEILIESRPIPAK